ncbi:hypothetical protein F5B20DRAFT_542250 [Whalleya microplaca]|nr:hypothetical protein F5B20DRAFT_542250 [Whalleya microplaca]
MAEIHHHHHQQQHTPTPTPRYAHAGGFIPPVSLPSPAPSSASSRVAALLPHPRSKPLVPGSRKEDYARHYVSERLLHISRRFVKHHGIPDPADEVAGYPNMDEACRDLEEVVDVLWFSGTPSLQVPYLLNVALAITTYLPSFPAAPRPTFALLRKLDHCFASLLVGRDVKSGDPLPGFNTDHVAFTRTEMVRCKSLADETRMLVAVVMSNEPDVEDNPDPDTDADETDAAAPLTATALRGATCSLPKQQTSGPGNGVKTEEFEVGIINDWDEESSSDNEDSKPTSEPEPAAAHGTKRKALTDSGTAVQEDTKRIKQEDAAEQDAQPSPTPHAPDSNTNANPTPTPTNGHSSSGPASGPGNGAQFHWLVDSDDDESDVETLPNTSAAKPTTTTSAQISAAAAAVLATSQNSASNLPNGEGDAGDENGYEGEGMVEDPSDEEEEELHLNVARVYEKTLVQLGKSLGESIISNKD